MPKVEILSGNAAGSVVEMDALQAQSARDTGFGRIVAEDAGDSVGEPVAHSSTPPPPPEPADKAAAKGAAPAPKHERKPKRGAA